MSEGGLVPPAFDKGAFMCGIVGYTGEASATPILVEGLTRMEYRGYDSAGRCV